MCGRYRAQSTGADVEKLWKVPPSEAAEAAMERREVRPTTQIAVITQGGNGPVAEAVRWGVQPAWGKNPRPIINARSDKLATSKLWKRLATNSASRTLIVCDGWYEWLRPEQPKSKARAQPFLHLLDDGRLFALAGLIGQADVKGETMSAATIITTDAAGAAAQIHNRMPVVLPDPERQAAWLSDGLSLDDVVELCAPLADGVTAQPVDLGSSRPVNSQ